MSHENDSGNARGEEWLRREDADAADELAEAKADILGRLRSALDQVGGCIPAHSDSREF